MWIVPISTSIMSIIPILLIMVFDKIDSTIDIALTRKNIAIILTNSFIIAFARFILYLKVGCEPCTPDIIHMDIMFAYLIFMSYTDQKTKLLYTTVSLAMIVLEITLSIINISSIMEFANTLTWTIILIPVGLLILSAFRGIGLGDVYIYMVICLYTLQISHIPTFVVILNLLIANVLFVISSICLKLFKKNKDKHLPLTIHITIASVVCSIVFINF